MKDIDEMRSALVLIERGAIVAAFALSVGALLGLAIGVRLGRRT